MSISKNDTLFWGVLVLLLGVLFLLKNLGLNLNIWHFLGKFWPMILIFIGAKNIIIHLSRKK